MIGSALLIILAITTITEGFLSISAWIYLVLISFLIGGVLGAIGGILILLKKSQGSAIAIIGAAAGIIGVIVQIPYEILWAIAISQATMGPDALIFLAIFYGAPVLVLIGGLLGLSKE